MSTDTQPGAHEQGSHQAPRRACTSCGIAAICGGPPAASAAATPTPFAHQFTSTHQFSPKHTNPKEP